MTRGWTYSSRLSGLEPHLSESADPTGQAPPPWRPPLGPLATRLGQAYVVGALIFGFGVLFDVLPPKTALVLLVPAFACVVLAPRELVFSARISLPLSALLAWMALSWGWSVNPGETAVRLWTGPLLVLALLAVTAVLRIEDLASAVRWNIRITIAVIVLALVTRPTARISGSDDFLVQGWRGTFTDKNAMALYLVFALVATLTLDRSRLARAVTIGIIAVLLLGSQSATGLSAALFALVLSAWLGFLRRATFRQSALIVLTSLGAALLLAAVAAMNVPAIVGIYGRDVGLSGRTGIWFAVAHEVADRPVTGYGLGALLNVNAPSPVTLDLWRQIGFRAAHAHNGALDVVGQLGAVGLALYVMVFWAAVRTAACRLRSAPRTATFALVMLSALLVMSVSENVFLGPWLLVLVIVQAPLLRPVLPQPATVALATQYGSRHTAGAGVTSPSMRRPSAD